MFAGDIYEPKKIRLVDIPEPEFRGQGGEILFQTELACLCGSDVPYFEHTDPWLPPRIGHSLHEMIGTVLATTGTRFQPGDRVLCVPEEQLGFFERYCISEQRAIPLDPRPSDEHAVIAQPLGTVICALRKLPPWIDLNVVIVGAGPIGQLMCATLRNLGARQIIAVDPLAERLEVSRRMGSTSTLDPTRQDVVEAVRELTGGTMADVVIEAVGHHDQALHLCTDLCRHLGRILVFGVPPEKLEEIMWRKLFMKNITLYTSVGPDFRSDFPLAMRWIAEKRIDVGPVVTHRFPLSQLQQAFETFAERKDGALKVLLDFPAQSQSRR